jgi:G3E family GTPase
MVWIPENHFGRHLPFVLLTGFLGSGKTSVLNRMLKDRRLANTAVAINEFGEVPVDQDLIDAKVDDLIVLSNGCMCCFGGQDLERSLSLLFKASETGEAPEFKRLIIETSGLADPELVLQAVLDSPVASRFLWLDSIVTTVDAVYGLQQIETHPQALRQIRLATTLLITKTDLVSSEAVAGLRARLLELNPAAKQLLATDGDVDPADFCSPTFFDSDADRSLVGDWAGRNVGVSGPQGRPEPDHHGETGHSHDGHNHEHHHDHGHAYHDHRHHHDEHVAGVETVALRADTPLDWHRFQLWLGRRQRQYREKLLRVKGLVNVTGSDRPVIVHAVQTTSHVPVSLAHWPSDDQSTRVVFILHRTAPAELRSSWLEFLSREEALAETGRVSAAAG